VHGPLHLSNCKLEFALVLMKTYSFFTEKTYFFKYGQTRTTFSSPKDLAGPKDCVTCYWARIYVISPVISRTTFSSIYEFGHSV